ncbi:Enoyl-CoA hydratase/carnithine racemase [Ruminococcus flavefaciens]|uniref:Enoyl-CoA hydratase/carnithine racemase n=1 Tax=Ruminococcus flavefaciens TaxID=1265 RepID=A0A1H6L9Q7_RUMFL|nr:enoyl-CoA hydratase/isomerase family protein [Ruminococcus flavefaciens]SEH84967.1 Enoyl-CoA hydratase/carnithine racemase [Ruminococcus flavefaciens]
MLRTNLSELYAEDNIAVLTIDNGPKNLLTEPEFADRKKLLGWLDENPQVGALIITGKGRHFSHGADVSLFGTSDSNELSAKLENARELLRTIEKLPIITAAAINGGCFGGGLEIALSCQFRIASPSAFLGLPEIMHGVVPGMGGMERLYRLLGKEKALQMILCGEMIGAKEALDMGLVTKLSENRNSFDETKAFVKELLNGKSLTQIHAIIDTINLASDGVTDPSKGKFEAALAEASKQ